MLAAYFHVHAALGREEKIQAPFDILHPSIKIRMILKNPLLRRERISKQK
jgi:hypothetical protein